MANDICVNSDTYITIFNIYMKVVLRKNGVIPIFPHRGISPHYLKQKREYRLLYNAAHHFFEMLEVPTTHSSLIHLPSTALNQRELNQLPDLRRHR